MVTLRKSAGGKREDVGLYRLTNEAATLCIIIPLKYKSTRPFWN